MCDKPITIIWTFSEVSKLCLVLRHVEWSTRRSPRIKLRQFLLGKAREDFLFSASSNFCFFLLENWLQITSSEAATSDSEDFVALVSAWPSGESTRAFYATILGWALGWDGTTSSCFSFGAWGSTSSSSTSTKGLTDGMKMRLDGESSAPAFSSTSSRGISSGEQGLGEASFFPGAFSSGESLATVSSFGAHCSGWATSSGAHYIF